MRQLINDESKFAERQLNIFWSSIFCTLLRFNEGFHCSNQECTFFVVFAETKVIKWKSEKAFNEWRDKTVRFVSGILRKAYPRILGSRENLERKLKELLDPMKYETPDEAAANIFNRIRTQFVDQIFASGML